MDNLKHKWLLSPTKKDFDIVAEMKDIKESTDHLVSVSNAMKMRKTEEIIADIRRDLFLAINPIVSKLDKDKFIVEETTNLDLYEGEGQREQCIICHLNQKSQR
ncbi:hypothetical protein QO179_24390 [Bacillus stercoris]|nr:hypothetical protein [Bacillus stercoris]